MSAEALVAEIAALIDEVCTEVERADRLVAAIRSHLEACEGLTATFTLEDLLDQHDEARRPEPPLLRDEATP